MASKGKRERPPPLASRWHQSRAIEFGGVPLSWSPESLVGLDPAREIPSIVIDGMLRSIVEGHWRGQELQHVPTGTIVAPGMRELLEHTPAQGAPRSWRTGWDMSVGGTYPGWSVRTTTRCAPTQHFAASTGSAARNGRYISISDWGIVLSGEDGKACVEVASATSRSKSTSSRPARKRPKRLRRRCFVQ